MEVIRTIEWMKQASRAAQAAGRVTGFVPTMGALHEGHASLIRAARQQCSPVVVSVFVNPKQFGLAEDFEKYPRNLGADIEKLEALHADYLFAPPVEEIYPRGFRTSVEVEGLSERLEGRSRPGHFRGVATIVLKLCEIIEPRFAYFGRKDAQQARIVRQLVSDLNLDIEFVVCPIVREPDGLALSSRNVFLSPEERRAAASLFRALKAVKQDVESGERDSLRLLDCLRRSLASEPLVKLDYAEIVDGDAFEPVTRLRGGCLVLLAAFVGSTRLIDNLLVEESPEGLVVSL